MRTALSLVVLAALGLPSAAMADFIPGNLIVMRVSTSTASGAVVLDEYNPAVVNGPAVSSIFLPTDAQNGVSSPQDVNHGRHLHLSADGRFISFAVYGTAPTNSDVSTTSSATTPRVVGLLGASGSVDLSTRLNNYDLTAVRGAYTTDGTQIWVHGDNAGGTTTTGGIRYTTVGSTSSNNLSRTQVTGGSPQPDNVREALIAGGQLFDSSGSSSSLGRAVFQVGLGMPTSGSQTATALTTDNQSVSSFAFLDLNPSIPGVDTLYTVGDATLRRYNLVGGVWVGGTAGTGGLLTGLNVTAGTLDQIAVRSNGLGGVSIFLGGPNAVLSYTDATPMGAALAGSPSLLLSAPAGYTFGGLDFAPVPAPSAAALLAAAGALAARRRR